ncbi:MAG: adenylate/guanylate cyclase domain-containing protein [Verrucomicrobiota bacterium]
MNAIASRPASRILVVDDTPANIQTLAAILKEQGYQLSVATNGRQALEVVARVRPDLILLDVMMPEMDGFEACRRLKETLVWRDIPVIFLTAKTETADLVKGFELGAVDYVGKPFNAHELLARVNTHLTIDRLRRENERLLLNILPLPIAERLKAGAELIADHFDEVSVLFADLVGFTELSSRRPAAEIVQILNELFSRFDQAADELGVEKIKTIGDAYMAVCGLPEPRADHADRMVRMALRMLSVVREFNAARGVDLSTRIGIHAGPVVAGVIGRNKFIYDLWGDTVNLASRMESHGTAGAVQMTQNVVEPLAGRYPFEARGVIDVKGRGAIETWLLRE